MAKIKVSTLGDTTMQDPTNGAVIEHKGETEVERTAWVENQIALGKLVSDTKVDEDDLKSSGQDAPNPGLDSGGDTGTETFTSTESSPKRATTKK